LSDLSHTIDCDVLVCGDDAQAREAAIALANDAGMRAWHAGVLANSVAAEALTSVLIAINKRYKVAGSGIRITGVPSR
jgi:predicted dinucleotide-binding enzyme